MEIFERDRAARTIPVAVVTGFLGSGKTTLINRLLRDRRLADTAVIVNELGDIPLDHLLVEAVDGETVVLAGGCICCAVRSDLESTLRDLLHRRNKGAIPAFSRVVVETTGLADPAPIAQMLLNNPLVTHFFRLDAIVTVVDSVHGAVQLAEHDEALHQVAIADRLVLSKTDMAEADALRRRLVDLNPGATILAVTHGDIAPEDLLGEGWLDPSRAAARAPRPLPEVLSDRHRHDIATLSLTADRPLDWQAVQAWLGRLRETHGEGLLRVKGILDLDGQTGPVVIHGVRHVFHSPVRLDAWPDSDRRSRLVLITRGLDREALTEGWRELSG
jgi:G3E family GTPase